ncbi:MAG TPA: hypothetical protein VFA58_07605 [Chthoniobacterales bacterium]|nr:hypothetical protein [Chthoniobacterales bacterium]
MNRTGKSVFSRSAPIVCGVSLVALAGAGWLDSTGARTAISALAAAGLIWSLVQILREIDFTAPKLLNATARQLAWIRILVCLTALIYTAMENLPLFAHQPPEMRNNYKFWYLLNHLPGATAVLDSPSLLGALQWTTALFLLLALVGFQTRMALCLGAVGFFFTQAVPRHYTYFYHSGLVPVYLLLLLPWTPCAAAWSVDRLLNRSKAQPNPQSVGLGIFAAYAVMATVYLMSGLSKLRDSGWAWFSGENIEQKLVRDALEPIFLNYDWKATLWLVQHHAPDYVFAFIGVFGLVAELGYVAVLFSRKAQLLLPIMAFAVHLGILVFQHILFLDLLLLQLVFLDVDRVAIFWGQRVRSNIGPSRPPNVTSKPAMPVSDISIGSLALVVAMLLFAWVWRVEYYPISSWHMYANPEKKGPVYYVKIAARLEDGRTIDIPLADCSPAVIPNIRFFLLNAFRRSGRNPTIDQFFAGYVQRRNRDLAFGSPITSLDLQRRRWNYVTDPNDPRFGWAVDVYPYDATSKPSLGR